LASTVVALEASEWDAPALEETARELASSRGMKLGQIAQPIRAAITGRTVSPPIFAALAALGRDESLIRLRAYVS
jgi:glutamyl-tRNA synthetase